MYKITQENYRMLNRERIYTRRLKYMCRILLIFSQFAFMFMNIHVCISNTLHIIFLFFTEARIQWSIDPDQSSLNLWMMFVVTEMNQARDVNSFSSTSFNQLKLQSRLVSGGHDSSINQSKLLFNTESLSPNHGAVYHNHKHSLFVISCWISKNNKHRFFEPH